MKSDRKLATSIAKQAGNLVFEIMEKIYMISSTCKQLHISRVYSHLHMRGLLRIAYIEP